MMLTASAWSSTGRIQASAAQASAGRRGTGSRSLDDDGGDPFGPGATRRRRVTADRPGGSPPRRAGQGPDPQWPSPTRTWRGGVRNGSTGRTSPRSIPRPWSRAARRLAGCRAAPD